MSRLPKPGSDRGTWGDILNDFLSVAHNSDGSLKDTGVVANKYTFPSGGIPRTDMTADVQASLANADAAVSGSVPDATSSTKGKLQLTGDLTGTAASPAVAAGAITGTKIATGTITDTNVSASAAIAQSKIANLTTDLAGKAPTTRTITAGTGLTGGGDLSADRTLTVSYGTTAGTAAEGNDSRITGAVQASNNLSDLVSASTARTNIGLGNVDNTSDANKPVSTAQAAADNLRLLKAGDTMSGLLQFSGTGHPGLQLNSLTSTQRDSLSSPSAGSVIYNSTNKVAEIYANAKSLTSPTTNEWQRVGHKGNTVTPYDSALRQWYNALGNRSSQSVNAIVLGDSISEGWTAGSATLNFNQTTGSTSLAWDNRYMTILMRALQRQFGGNSPGYYPAQYAFNLPASPWTTTGTITSDNTSGLGLRCVRLASADASMSMTILCDRVSVFYNKQQFSGNIKIDIDGVNVANFNTTTGNSTEVGGQRWDSGAITGGLAVHTIKIYTTYALSFPAIIEGMKVYQGDWATGVHVWDAAHFGYKVSSYISGGMYGLDPFTTVAPDLVILNIGINDYGSGDSVSTLKTNYQTLITNILAKSTGTTNPPSILMVIPYSRGDASHTEAEYLPYRQMFREVAHENGCAIFDAYELFGSFGGGTDPYGFTVDYIHPGTKGHRIYGEQLAAVLCGRRAGVHVSTDSTFTNASDNLVASQLAVKTYVSGLSASGSAGGDLTGTYPNPTIANNAVTNAKAAQMAAHTYKGNNTGSTANASDLTGAQLLADLSGAATGSFSWNSQALTSIGAATISATGGTGVITMASQTATPSAPAAGNAEIFAQKLAGRNMLWVRGANGLPYPVAPHASSMNYVEARPTTTTGFSTWGSLISNGTVSTITFTEALGLQTNLASAASVSSLAGIQGNNFEFMRGSAATNKKYNGFFFHAVVYFPDASYNNTGASTGTRVLVGMTDQTASTALGSDNPAGNRATFSWINANGGRTDTNWQFSLKDNTTENLVDTGMAWTVQHLYEMWIYCPGAGSTIYWRIDDCTAGTTQEGNSGTNLPSTTAIVKPMAELLTIDATARNLRFNEFRCETCR